MWPLTSSKPDKKGDSGSGSEGDESSPSSSTANRRSTRPAHHANDNQTSFKNPWPSASAPSFGEMVSGGLPIGLPHRHLHKHPKARELQVVKPDWGRSKLDAQRRENSGQKQGGGSGSGSGSKILGTWLGHASTWCEIPLVASAEEESRCARLLFDPIFSGRAGPTAYTGPARVQESPCQLDELPGCNAVLISHNHYDHLDLSSIQSVIKQYPSAYYFVPLGNRKWFIDTGAEEDRIKELDWWDEVEFCPEELGYKPDAAGAKETSRLRFTCVPSQHNSGRVALDQGTTLWCGWVVEHFVHSSASKGGELSTERITRKGAIYHAGDTGYRRHKNSKVVCPAFEEIGKRFGPFDLSFIPIWRGGSLGFVSWVGLRLAHENIPAALHGSPTDAVAIHADVKSRNSIGVHFGTFIGAAEEALEAMIELQDACEDADVEFELDQRGAEKDKGRFGVVDLGETVVIDVADLVIV